MSTPTPDEQPTDEPEATTADAYYDRYLEDQAQRDLDQVNAAYGD